MYLCYRIISIIAETDFKEVTHSLDVWHKAKSIKKCLDKVSSQMDVHITSFHNYNYLEFMWQKIFHFSLANQRQ